MKKLYVVGNNTSKSLSPLIFNYWFSKYKLKAKYEYIEVDHKNLHKEVSAVLNDKKTIGLNITIPYKKKIMKYVGSFDKHSTKIKAVNFVINKGSRKGFNTDWIGYFNSIRRVTNLKKMVRNEIPAFELISGALIAIGAIFLIIPGFATDLVGFLIIFPPTRKVIFKKFSKKNKRNNYQDKEFIEGDFKDLDE